MPKRKCSSIDTNLGHNLVFYRKALGLTQQKIADKLNINRTTYTKYETGVSEPSIEILKKISLILDVDLNTILSDDEPSLSRDTTIDNRARNRQEDKLLIAFRLLPEDQRNTLIQDLEESIITGKHRNRHNR